MIAIYHPVSLERQCNIVRLLSAEWHNRLYEPGEFDIRLPPDAEGQEYLKLHSVISHKGNYGVILGIEAAAHCMALSRSGGYCLRHKYRLLPGRTGLSRFGCGSVL